MYCKLLIGENESSVIETIDWFHSIGVDWISEKRLDDMYINIEFVNTPKLLETMVHLETTLSVTRISDKGVTFYLIDFLSERERIEFDFGGCDGTVFVPMSNIKSINTLGNIKEICVQ